MHDDETGGRSVLIDAVTTTPHSSQLQRDSDAWNEAVRATVDSTARAAGVDA